MPYLLRVSSTSLNNPNTMKYTQLSTNEDDYDTIYVLHLVLYSKDLNDIYEDMYQTTRSYYHSFIHVKTVYYTFSSTIEDDYILIDDILYIKGNTQEFIIT